MCAEVIVFNNTAPVGVYHIRALVLITYSVTPVVVVSKTAARPSEYWYIKLFKRVYYISSHSVYILYSAVRFYINSFIDTASEVFRKLTVNIFVYNAVPAFCVDLHICHCFILLLCLYYFPAFKVPLYERISLR